MFKFVPTSLFLLLSAPNTASANDLQIISDSWSVYTTHCQQVFNDPRAYISTLPDRNQGGDLTQTVSPDGKALTVYFEVGDGYIEAYIDTLSDREIRHCAFYSELSSGWDANSVASQYVQWIGQNPDIKIVGGYSPIYGYDHYRHTVLGIWPSYDIEVQTNIHENEFQIISTLVVR